MVYSWGDKKDKSLEEMGLKSKFNSFWFISSNRLVFSANKV